MSKYNGDPTGGKVTGFIRTLANVMSQDQVPLSKMVNRENPGFELKK